MAIIFFLFGIVTGSFLNVCIYRIPRRESVAWPGSHCPDCGYALKWYDLFPVLSYLFLRGKCRQCRSHISLQYPLVELATGLLFSAAYLKFGLGWNLAGPLVLIAWLIMIGLIDLKHMIIPDRLVVPGVLLGLGYLFLPGSPAWIPALAAALGTALLFLLLWYFREMGMGDVKLALMLGLFLGWPGTAAAVFLGCLSGAVTGVIIIAVKGGGRKTPVPFGLFLALGSLATLFYGQELVAWYLRLTSW